MLIAVASCERRPADPPTAEFAMYVDESHPAAAASARCCWSTWPQRRGSRVTELVGEVLPTNAGMLGSPTISGSLRSSSTAE